MAFLSSVGQTTVVKFYSNVMDDVLAGVREAFMDEGVDEQVLQDLRQMWEAKVLASKAIDPPEVVEPQPPPLEITPVQSDTKPNVIQQKPTNGVQVQSQTSKPKSVAPVTLPTLASAAPAVSSNTVLPSVTKTFGNSQTQPQTMPSSVMQDLNKMLPIQLTLPAPAGSQENRIFNLQVPASALASGQLQRILTPQIISATLALPHNVASTLLQQHITASVQSQANNVLTNANNSGNVSMNGAQGVLLPDSSNNQFQHVNQIQGNISQLDGTCDSPDDEIENATNSTSNLSNTNGENRLFSVKILYDKLLQLDGIYDTSDDDEDDDDDIDDDDDDDDDNDDKEDDDNDEAENGVEEDPLNSGDDVSEGDNTDLFETENVVVCQYDKINRSRNKWKFYLKDGIMNLAGRDYIFQKANGDAEW